MVVRLSGTFQNHSPDNDDRALLTVDAGVNIIMSFTNQTPHKTSTQKVRYSA